MSEGPIDISHTLTANSNQLNADDLLGGPATVQILRVRLLDGEQPVEIDINGGFKPWRPCKTMRRLLGHPDTWKADASQWLGRWVTLYRDPEVNSPDGTKNAGGIRVSHMSHIRGNCTVSLTEKRGGKKKAWHVAKLTPPTDAREISVDDLRKWATGATKERGWSKEQVLALFGAPSAADVPTERRAEIVALLKGPPPPPAEEAAGEDDIP